MPRVLRGAAFTLVELMIVVVIVAILAMTAIPLYRSSIAHAREIEGIGAVGSIRTVLRVYAAAHDRSYPTLAGVDGNGLGGVGIMGSDLDGKYFSAGDYTVVSDAASYTITATDPDTGLIYEIDENGTETAGVGYYNSGH